MQPETAFARVPDSALTEADPPLLYPDYVGTRLRAPEDPLVLLPSSLSELTGPVYGDSSLQEADADLTRQHPGEPLGERIVVTGRVLGSDGKPLRGQLVEIWREALQSQRLGDKTVQIAHEFTDKVSVRPWPGFAAQKNVAATLARHTRQIGGTNLERTGDVVHGLTHWYEFSQHGPPFSLQSKVSGNHFGGVLNA